MEKVASLEAEIAFLKNGRKSTTSSTPASQNFTRSNTKSLRVKGGRLPGGQPNHEGKTLEMTSNPDSIIEHRPRFCKKCGSQLPETQSLLGRRQEIVIPPIVPQL